MEPGAPRTRDCVRKAAVRWWRGQHFRVRKLQGREKRGAWTGTQAGEGPLGGRCAPVTTGPPVTAPPCSGGHLRAFSSAGREAGRGSPDPPGLSCLQEKIGFSVFSSSPRSRVFSFPGCSSLPPDSPRKVLEMSVPRDTSPLFSVAPQTRLAPQHMHAITVTFR